MIQTPYPRLDPPMRDVQGASKFYTRNYPIRPDIHAHQSLLLNPFQPIGFSHYHKLGQSISVLKVVWWYFENIISKHTVETQVRRCVVRHLIWICAAYASQKKTLCLYTWVKSVTKILQGLNIICFDF